MEKLEQKHNTKNNIHDNKSTAAEINN